VGVEVFSEASRGFKPSKEILLGDREAFETLEEVFSNRVGSAFDGSEEENPQAGS